MLRLFSTNYGGRLICALAVIFILGGCFKAGPDFVRPSTAVSPNWLESGDTRVKTGPAEYRDWWKAFNDPVLDTLVERAYRQNLTLQIAGLRVLQARAQLGIAVGNLFPQSQAATGSYQYNRLSEGAAQAGFASGGLSYTQDQIGVGASWELDFWGRFRRAIESADAGWLAAVANYDNTLVSLTADVANSYIQIRTLEKRIDIALQNADIQKQTLSIAETRFKFGSVSRLDVEQARAALGNTLATIPPLRAQLRQTTDALSVLLGVPPGEQPELMEGTGHIPVSPPEVVVGIPEELLRRRPDIRIAEYQAVAQCAQIGVAKADLYPAFSLSGTFGFLAASVGQSSTTDIFKWQNRTYQIGPAFQWNIFNYGRITNNIRFQDALFQETIANYRKAVLAAQQDVEDNIVSFLRQQERAELLAESAAAAREALDLAVMQYRAGLKDFTAVLNAEQALLAQQDSLASTLGGIAGSLIGVYRALGGGWEIRAGQELIPLETKSEMAKRTNWGRLLLPACYNPPVSRERTSDWRRPDW